MLPPCYHCPLAIQTSFCNPSFLVIIYLTLDHICSRLAQASTLPNPVAESTQHYIQFLSSGMELHMPSTLPAINWAAINLDVPQSTTQSCPERKQSVFIFVLFALYFQCERIVFTLFWKGIFEGMLSLLFFKWCWHRKKSCIRVNTLTAVLWTLQGCDNCRINFAGHIASWQEEPLGLPAHGLLCL